MNASDPGTDSSAQPQPRPQRKPGKLRRWLLRPMMWGLAATALLIFSLHLLLQSDWAAHYFAKRAEAGLEGLLARDVEIDWLRIKLLPLGLELGEVQLAGLDPGGPPLFAAARIIVDAEVVDLQQMLLSLHEVRVERPVLNLDFFAEGGNNLPHRMRRARGGEKIKSPVKLAIHRLVIVDGLLQINQERLPLELSVLGLRTELSGRSLEDLTGRVTATSVEVTPPQANPVSATVGIRIALDSTGARVVSGRLSAPDLSLALRGRTSWAEQEYVVEVEGQGNTSLLGRMGYLRDEIEGGFHVDGGFAWSERSWGFRADLDSPSLRIFDLDVGGIEGVVSGDRNGVRFDIARAAYAGGKVSGKVNVETAREARSLELDLNLDSVDLQQLIDDRELPVEALAGRVSGVFDYRFPFGHARQGEGWADLRIEADETRGLGRVLVRGTVPLLIEQGIIRTQAARVIGPYQSLLASGFYDLERRSGSFEYRLESERVERLKLLLPLEDEDTQLWFPTSGSGLLEGTLLLAPGAPSTLLRLDLHAVEAPGATADRVQGTMTIGVDGVEDLRLELLRSDAGLIVTGSLPFGDEVSAETRIPFLLSVDSAGWPVADFKPWLPFEVPVDGPLSGSLSLWGEMGDPSGQARVTVTPAAVQELEVEQLDLLLDLDPERVRIERLAARIPAGEVVLSGDWDRPSDELALRVRADGLLMDQAPFLDLMPGGLAGSLMIDGSVEGNSAHPRLVADLEWRELALGDILLGDQGRARVSLSLANESLELSGDLLGLVHLDGGGRLDASGTELRLVVTSRDLAGLARLVGSDTLPQVTGGFEGTVTVMAEFASADSWQAVMELDTFEMEYAAQRLENLEPVKIRLGADGVRIESFFVADQTGDSDLFLAGRVALDESRSLDLRLQSSLQINWLELLLPELGLRSGRFDMLATIRGSADRPSLNGQGRLEGGRALVPGLPFSLERIEGIVLFYPEQIILDQIDARGAGGILRASGSLRPLTDEEGFDYRLQIQAADLTVPFPEGWTSRGDAEIVVSSTDGGRQVRGSVEVERALYVQDVKLSLAQMLQGLFSRRRLEVERADELAATTELNLAVRGEGALRVRNNLADLGGDLDLVVRGTLARPVVFGQIEVERDGTIVFGINEYRIEQGRLNFANPFEIEPIIDLVAVADVREYDVTLSLTGTLDRLNASFSSNPPLADLEILSLLATGEQDWTASASTSQGESQASAQASAFLYGQAATLITQRTSRLFGLDRFRVQPPTGSSGELSSARVTVGKQLSRDLFVTYSYDPATSEEQVFQVEWSVSRGLTLVLTQNGDESYGVDVRWERSF